MLAEYLRNIKTMPGWCIPEVWNCIEPISIFQEEHNINGPIAEIGVFKGKFFCGLALTKGVSLNHCAIDIFDQQQFNLDDSGIGDINVFRKNLKRFRINNTEIHKTDSLSIGTEFVTERERKYSFFSVDGCHTIEHTINDFKLAMKMVRNDGIIFMDDYYNPLWPGVQEGLSKFYLNESCNFVPLLFTCNKLFICNISYHKLYFEFVRNFLFEHYPQSKIKQVKRFGYNTLTVMPKWSVQQYVIDRE